MLVAKNIVGNMKFIVNSVMLFAIIGNVKAGEPLPVTTVEQVDLNRYCGTWYEIARLPNWFQRKCSCNTTAAYSMLLDGRIRVVNRCQKADSSVITAEGIARKKDSDGSNAKLEVRFAPSWLGWLPMVWGTYWIIDLAPDYSYAAVGDPSRKYLWILSRTKSLDPAIRDAVINRLKSMGFDTDKLINTHQE
jgi:apolipoprotein D and lipocalin family protein